MDSVSASICSTEPCAITAEYDIIYFCIIQVNRVVFGTFSFAAYKYRYCSAVTNVERIIFRRASLSIFEVRSFGSAIAITSTIDRAIPGNFTTRGNASYCYDIIIVLSVNICFTFKAARVIFA